MTGRMIATQTMLSSFRSCRRACEWRYVHQLVPLEENAVLHFGSVIHRALEVWHRDRHLDRALAVIDAAYVNRAADASERADWSNARAMMRGYAARYPTEEFEVICLEKVFEGPIVNPATGAHSRKLAFAGRIDGIVRLERKYFVLETKTTARIDEAYLEGLWISHQPVYYSIFAREVLGIPVVGILWNVLEKARLQQGRGETDEEFARRRADLAAKNKSGTTRASKWLPESDESFQARLAEKYANPAMYHRLPILLDMDRVDEVKRELWELTQAFNDARRRSAFYQNPAFCFHHGRPCAYLPLCRSGGNPALIENAYRRVEPHEELRERPAEQAPPVEPGAVPAF